MESHQQPAARLHVATQFAARRPWVPSAAALRRWARAAHATATGRTRRGRRDVAVPEAAVCIRIVGAAASRRLNAGYRAKDKPTNVLSIPASRVGRALDGSLGDLVICATVVAAEARAQGKALVAHWAHMVIHGTLHLLGFDHAHQADARRMESRERALLARLGIGDPYGD